MIQIGDVVVSFDVLREKFICNLDACKGACCVEGDAGAPVELDEIEKQLEGKKGLKILVNSIYDGKRTYTVEVNKKK